MNALHQEVTRKQAEMEAVELAIGTFASALIKVDQSLRLISKQVYGQNPPSLTEALQTSGQNHSLYKVMRSLLTLPQTRHSDPQTPIESLVSKVSQQFELCMAQVLSAYSQVQKQPAPDALQLENQGLTMQIAELQANLTLSETKLASQQANQTIDHVRRQLHRAETELQKLHLRYENRPQPYFSIIREHFNPQELSKFVDPAHQCQCNHCGKDLTLLAKPQHEEPLKARDPQPSEELCDLRSANEELKLVIQAKEMTNR